jgi:hypothetical protein
VRYGLPDHIIKIIMSLYDRAETVIVINGVISSPFGVNRGVRQRDPLSCLLFNLAIEPLATMIQNLNLAGYTIQGLNNKLVTSLFVNDTTVYLTERDNFSDLQDILATWCNVSEAKFNIKKTEIIPIGNKGFRDALLQTRQLSPGQQVIPEEIHIAKDGESIRLLGAWIGNSLDNVEPWSPILEKVDKYLNQWAKSYPTLKGKRLIVQMVMGGVTQGRYAS